MQSLYNELGIQPNASLAEIKKAYRSMAKKYHPDLNKDPTAEAKFKKVNEAYNILTNDDAKRDYVNKSRGHRRGGNGGFGSMNMNDIFKNFGGMGFGGSRGDPMHFNMGPQKVSLEIPLDVMLKGETLDINIGGHEAKVIIPTNCENGLEIIYKENGLDIIIVITAARNYDSATVIINNDIMRVITVDVLDVMFGTTKVIRTPFGEVEVVVPENTKQTDKIIMKGLGLSYAKGTRKGNLVIQLNISIPSKSDFIDKISKDVDLMKILNERDI